MASSKIFWFGVVFLIIMLLALLVFSIIGVYDIVVENTEKERICVEQGWAGAEIEDQDSSKFKCYKEVPHSSGLGFLIVYSGELDFKDVGDDN